MPAAVGRKIRRNRRKTKKLSQELRAARADGAAVAAGYKAPTPDKSLKGTGNRRDKLKYVRQRRKAVAGKLAHLEYPKPDRVLSPLQEIEKDNRKARRTENSSLYNRQVATNELAQDRYGIDVKRSASRKERESIIRNVNDRLRIKPDSVDPTRKVDTNTKRIAQSFAALDNLATDSTDKIDHGQVRLEVARLRGAIEEVGNQDLADKLTGYLKKYTSTDGNTDGNGFGLSRRKIQEIQNWVRDDYNVDYLLPMTQGAFDPVSKAFAVNAAGDVYLAQTVEQVLKDKQASFDRFAERQAQWEGDYEPGSLRNRPEPTFDAQAVNEYYDGLLDDAYANQQGLPWWAK